MSDDSQDSLMPLTRPRLRSASQPSSISFSPRVRRPPSASFHGLFMARSASMPCSSSSGLLPQLLRTTTALDYVQPAPLLRKVSAITPGLVLCSAYAPLVRSLCRAAKPRERSKDAHYQVLQPQQQRPWKGATKLRQSRGSTL